MANWHYGGATPHATKNDWVGSFKTTAKQTEFEAVTTSVIENQFAFESNLIGVSLPRCIEVKNSGFTGIHLTSLNLPVCERIEYAGFIRAKLTSLDLPKVKNIGEAAFNEAPLTSLNIPECTNIGSDAFNAAKLTSLDLPKAIYINSSAFYNSPLTSLSIPEATFISRPFHSIVNLPTTHVTMKSTFNTPAKKNGTFGAGNWDQITFTWVSDSTPPDTGGGTTPPDTGGGTTPHPSTPTSITPDPAVAVTWHYGDGAGGPHATKNDWSGSFSSTAKQGEFEKITDHVDDHEFNAQEHLTAISLPQATKIGLYSFFISKMGAVNLPKVLSIGNNALYNTANNSQTKVTLPDLFDNYAEKNRIFGDHKWGHMSFTWTHDALPANTIFWNGKIQDTQFEMDGKTVVKLIWNGKECVLKELVPPGVDFNPDSGRWTKIYPSGLSFRGGGWWDLVFYKNKAIMLHSYGGWMRIADVSSTGYFSNFKEVNSSPSISSDSLRNIKIYGNKVYLTGFFAERWYEGEIDDDGNFTNIKTVNLSSKLTTIYNYWSGFEIYGNKVYFCNEQRSKFMTADIPDGWDKSLNSLTNFQTLNLSSKLTTSERQWNGIRINGNKMYFVNNSKARWMTADIDSQGNLTNFQTLDLSSKLTSAHDIWHKITFHDDKVYFINNAPSDWNVWSK